MDSASSTPELNEFLSHSIARMDQQEENLAVTGRAIQALVAQVSELTQQLQHLAGPTGPSPLPVPPPPPAPTIQPEPRLPAPEMLCSAVGDGVVGKSTSMLFLVSSEEMKRVFDQATTGREVARQRTDLRQGNRSVSDYAIDFRTLAAECHWNEEARRALPEHLPGKRQCPAVKERLLSGGISISKTSSSTLLPVRLLWGTWSHPTQALLDSGAEANFLDFTLAQTLGLPIATLKNTIAVSALNGQELPAITHCSHPLTFVTSGNHTEQISFLLLDSPMAPIVLGHPWLIQHSPRVDWGHNSVSAWRTSCHKSCLVSACSSVSSSVFQKEGANLSNVPAEYHDLQEVFSKSRAASLPPDRPYDCAIDLLPGYIVSSEGVRMDPDRVKAVMDWPSPDFRKALQRFLGFANFYRRFIRNFSQLAAPLLALTSPRVMFRWSDTAETVFAKLKSRFVSAPILVAPDSSRQFVVEVDASEVGVGAVLSQRSSTYDKMHPCAFLSHRLSPAECNYDIGNRELLAVKLALEEWRHWWGGRTKAKADHHRSKPPVYVVGQKVWLSTKNIPLRSVSNKLAPKFIGPFPVTKILSPVAVRLKLPPACRRIHPAFHVSKLKPVFHSHLNPPAPVPPPPRLVDGEPTYSGSMYRVNNNGPSTESCGTVAEHPPSLPLLPPFHNPASSSALTLLVPYTPSTSITPLKCVDPSPLVASTI
ncbi:uncharacterized protein LOC143718435 [Siphateles boraxobius]|uniref:uncharacterized protein LOC143718435 n=1 Tax=Siphateles boraxobius TaxID=180520 RepID=UPI004063F50A